MSLFVLPTLSSLVLAAAPTQNIAAVGTVSGAAGNPCVATLIAPTAAVTTRGCGVTNGSAVTFGGEQAIVFAVHRHADADLAVLELAAAPTVAPLPIYAGDELDAVSRTVGVGEGQALLVDDPAQGLVFAGLVAQDGTDIPSSEIANFHERANREGFFSGWDAETVVVIAGIATVGVIAGEAQEAGACQGGATSNLLALGFAIAVLAMLAQTRRGRRSQAANVK